MNILIYIPYISKSIGGVYNYSLNLIKTLLSDKENNYYIYNFNEDKNIKSLVNNLENFFIINQKKYSESRFDNKILRLKEIIKNNLNLDIKIKSKLDFVCKKYKIDIVHCPYQYLPNTSKKRIVTMHDVQELYFPEFFTSEQRAYRAVNYKKAIDNANKIIVSYEHVKKDLVKFFDKNPDDIEVILMDMKNLWFEKFINKKVEKLDKYKDYILYPAITWKHKNHKNLIIALSNVLKKNIDINLVCTGYKNEYYYNELEPLIKNLGLEKNVYFEGQVEEEYLYKLYKSAKAVVIPTLYEAGSFPLVESILLNVPVICSNVTSLPETIQNNEFVFNPYDIEDMTDKIINIISNNEYIRRNLDNSKRVSKMLSNNNALKKLKELYSNMSNS
ncbi:MAG: hypothetical protein KatS3mg068_0804 [Candidatus Sericytochromatia bacterium]|nr:MAG: hypothetical protein KatS3mg068_0804 [Candidatus Sericytochromatia bacterium]